MGVYLVFMCDGDGFEYRYVNECVVVVLLC